MAILAECPQCHKKQSVRNKACVCGKDLDKAKRANRKLHFQGKDYTCGTVRYWIDYIVPGTGKAKREPVAGGEDPKAYSIEEARAAEGILPCRTSCSAPALLRGRSLLFGTFGQDFAKLGLAGTLPGNKTQKTRRQTGV